jgi:hypothetical protein
MLLYGFSYTACDFATNKTEKKYEVSQTLKKTLNCQITDKFPPFFSKRRHKKNHGLDYFTETNLPKASN